MKTPKLLFLVNVDWFFVSHRLPIAIEAISKGYEVHVATTVTSKRAMLEELGLIVHDIDIPRSSISIYAALKNLLEIISLFRHIKPSIVHLVTIKPILLGGIAARIAKVDGVVAAISGLGFVFIDQGYFAELRRLFVKIIYRISLGHHNLQIICQNVNDFQDIQEITNLPNTAFSLINGSGVSLKQFKYVPLDSQQIPKIIMASRLLKDKGVNEFVAAAKIVKNSNIKAKFILVGEPDPENPSSIEMGVIADWIESGTIEYWGQREDMHNVLSQATIVVLPSYREGFPKILIEAAACGRAVITTDVPGCRDAIYNNITGLLVPSKNIESLAQAVTSLVSNLSDCHKMGLEGRKMAEEKFDSNIITAEHFCIYNQLLSNIK